MRTSPTAAIALAAALALSACATQPTQEQTGMVVGGVLGGVLGSQVGGGTGRTTATIIGAIAGAAIGSAVGRSMDENDRRRTAQVLEATPTGHATQWRNPDTGHQYTVTPTKTIATAEQPCREYTVDATIGGKKDTAHGTACRQADGSWKVVN